MGDDKHIARQYADMVKKSIRWNRYIFLVPMLTGALTRVAILILL